MEQPFLFVGVFEFKIDHDCRKKTYKTVANNYRQQAFHPSIYHPDYSTDKHNQNHVQIKISDTFCFPDMIYLWYKCQAAY